MGELFCFYSTITEQKLTIRAFAVRLKPGQLRFSCWLHHVLCGTACCSKQWSYWNSLLIDCVLHPFPPAPLAVSSGFLYIPQIPMIPFSLSHAWYLFYSPYPYTLLLCSMCVFCFQGKKQPCPVARLEWWVHWLAIWYSWHVGQLSITSKWINNEFCSPLPHYQPSVDFHKTFLCLVVMWCIPQFDCI